MANPQCENGYVKIANDLYDYLFRSDLSANEIKCLAFVIRKTYGFNKKEDQISLSQFVKYTNASRQTVVNSLNNLVKWNILVKSTILPIATYKVQKDYEKWVVKRALLVKSTCTTSQVHLQMLVKPTLHTKDIITKDKDNIYSERTLRICNDLKIKPTETLEEYISVIYKQYSFKQLVDVLKQWCFENNKKPSGLRLMNWIKRAVEKGELPLWEGEK